VNLDIVRTPFSKYGSYISVGKEPSGSLIVRSLRRRSGHERLLRLVFSHKGAPVDSKASATPGSITVQSAHGSALIAPRGDNGLVIESANLDIELSLVNGTGFGLRRGGRLELATDIARRFCDMVQRSIGNFENYDSLTGQGLREQGYSWTAAVHVLLLHEYLRNGESDRPVSEEEQADVLSCARH
jgi:hypothetical protein